ncbi:FAD-dependent oxidoreductase [Streptomyces sp. NPDC006332]|uniref:NAD(P)/FAD-dependent oxidoreductase n=1 Tax=Streptomyces sp. NPDC006332 TaxID=3155456 RepID=UPI0033BF6A39
METVVIVGAGQTGIQAAASAREHGYRGRLVVVGAEPQPPYQRPPLSKEHLRDGLDDGRLALRPPRFYADASIEVRTGVRVTALDRTVGDVLLADGERLRYDRLLLATGATPRELPVAAPSSGVMTLRHLRDANRLRAIAAEATHVVVVGAGFLGLEVASTMRALGKQVTVLEAAHRVLGRGVSGVVAAVLERAHQQDGVHFRLDESVRAWETRPDGRVGGVVTADGRSLRADLVVVAVGVRPNVSLASDAGLPTSDGIIVGPDLLTSDPCVAAAGDCARLVDVAARTSVRLESVQNASDQGRAIGAWLAGGPAPTYTAVPWFWSEQAGRRLTIAGLVGSGDGDGEEIVTRGDPAGGPFTAFHLRDGALVAAESIDATADHMAARRLLSSSSLRGERIARELLADPTVNLRAYAARRAEETVR